MSLHIQVRFMVLVLRLLYMIFRSVSGFSDYISTKDTEQSIAQFEVDAIDSLDWWRAGRK